MNELKSYEDECGKLKQIFDRCEQIRRQNRLNKVHKFWFLSPLDVNMIKLRGFVPAWADSGTGRWTQLIKFFITFFRRLLFLLIFSVQRVLWSIWFYFMINLPQNLLLLLLPQLSDEHFLLFWHITVLLRNIFQNRWFGRDSQMLWYFRNSLWLIESGVCDSIEKIIFLNDYLLFFYNPFPVFDLLAQQ